jgi:hypothetical protein
MTLEEQRKQKARHLGCTRAEWLRMNMQEREDYMARRLRELNLL